MKFCLMAWVFSLAIPAWTQSDNVARELQNTFRRIAQQVLPVVVQINTVNYVNQKKFNPFNFFFQFPDRSEEEPSPSPFEDRQFRSEGLGSGVIVERRKQKVYVLTNNHVVSNADSIEITLNDDRVFEGELVGNDVLRDLALISFETKDDVPVAKLGNSDDVWVGDWVLAIGSPLGLDATVTSGIISAKGRTTGLGQGQHFTDYLQTDASINQGNSGGPLVNLDGEVIGINTFIKTNSGGSMGLGFAIPINNVNKEIDDFIEKGTVEYAWLGVNMDNVNDIIAKDFDFDDRKGAFIYNVYGDSPAMKGDIQPGDLIIRFNNRAIQRADDLTRAVASQSPGDRVSVTLRRDGKLITLDVKLDVRTIEKDGLRVNVWPGFNVVPITDRLREQMNIPKNAGKVIIGSVVNNSPAASLGLRSGDVINAINNKTVKNLKHFFELVNDRDRLGIEINRKNQRMEFILKK